MTDGIIQEAFKPFFNRYSIDGKEIEKATQELIEKIKQEIPKLKEIRCAGWECGCGNGEYLEEESLLEKLIGDSQE